MHSLRRGCGVAGPLSTLPFRSMHRPAEASLPCLRLADPFTSSLIQFGQRSSMTGRIRIHSMMWRSLPYLLPRPYPFLACSSTGSHASPRIQELRSRRPAALSLWAWISLPCATLMFKVSSTIGPLRLSRAHSVSRRRLQFYRLRASRELANIRALFHASAISSFLYSGMTLMLIRTECLTPCKLPVFTWEIKPRLGTTVHCFGMRATADLCSQMMVNAWICSPCQLPMSFYPDTAISSSTCVVHTAEWFC